MVIKTIKTDTNLNNRCKIEVGKRLVRVCYVYVKIRLTGSRLQKNSFVKKIPDRLYFKDSGIILTSQIPSPVNLATGYIESRMIQGCMVVTLLDTVSKYGCLHSSFGFNSSILDKKHLPLERTHRDFELRAWFARNDQQWRISHEDYGRLGPI